ncbi:MAG: nucleotidyl transferase AbiEii/AbiGii toxin family protein [Candidatus Accumulibacter sp.]|jgi:hypothetical protein|nr:nucleotidyl transferase AbiEii/AbiGii toxin family protein [Accumulibacter sp.]
MFERPHHQRIARLLAAFDGERLKEAESYFGGGTGIVLCLNEYRESVDIDFLCASEGGYRMLRNIVGDDLGALLRTPVKHLREVRTDRYSIRTVLEIDEMPVKVELVREARIPISGSTTLFGVPLLSREDMFAEELLANADRGQDRATLSRDIIDLAMMIHAWGAIPESAWGKTRKAYGEQIDRAFQMSIKLLDDTPYLMRCLTAMKMDGALVKAIRHALRPELKRDAVESLDTEADNDMPGTPGCG